MNYQDIGRKINAAGNVAGNLGSTEAKIENDINTRPRHETFLSPSTTVIKLNNCEAK